jgi:(p)ppGpp synthase/HD superfamily hydrolase
MSRDDLTERARRFAQQAHEGQVRRYTGEPYVAHAERVAMAVARLTGDPEVIAAAFLHDVLEDTNTTQETLEALFGGRVAGIVVELTNVYTAERFPTINRAQRKGLERLRLATTSEAARLIKREDVRDNLPSIERHDQKFAMHYRAEAAALLAVLA